MSTPDPITPRVLRIPRSDEPNAFVLIHVSHTGPAPLDLTLTATEGESPYISSVKQSRLKDVRAKNFEGTDEEWAKIVSLVLGRCSVSADELSWPSDVEASASISGSGDEDKEIIITIRKRVQDITQRLGALTLKQDDEQAVELFEWAGIAASRADALQQQVVKLTHRYHNAEDTINKMHEQLKELMRAKSQHESQLIANFVQLLNEKKLKIRNQQRLLASATPDPAKVAAIQAATSGAARTAAGSTHTAKRSAQAIGDAASDPDDGFEKMDIDQRGPEEDSAKDQDTEDEERSTPQPLEEEEHISTDDELERPPAERGGPQVGIHRTTYPKRSSPPKEAAPLRRELPFTKRTKEPTTEMAPERNNDEAEETAGETDDDEL